MEATRQQNIFVAWFFWYFYEMPKFLLEVWKNYIIFAVNYFSFLALLKSFFSPWRRYRWMYPKNFDIVEFFNALISNTFSRVLGAMMRAVLIVFGLILQVFVIVVGLVVILLWAIAPFFVVACLLFAFVY